MDRIEVEALVVRVREHFVAQFTVFIEDHRRNCAIGAPELKLRLNEPTTLFQNLYCMDFVKRDGEYEYLQLEPERASSFESIASSVGAAALSIEALRWDDVIVRHDLASAPSDNIARWFRRWFDLDGERRDPDAMLSGVIHSLRVKPGRLSVDLGTAPADAFWEMLELLERAGARNIQIGGSGGEAAADH